MHPKSLKGSYLLVIAFNGGTVVARSKVFQLESGYYVYVGSAMKGLFSRIYRHEKQYKRNFWHIDYLLEKAKLVLSVLIPSEKRLEDEIASKLRGKPIPGFGASDSPLSSHLFYYKDFESALSDVFVTVTQVLRRN